MKKNPLIFNAVFALLILLGNVAYGQSEFNLPNDGKWYLVAQMGGRHGYFEYVYSHAAPHMPSFSTGEVHLINSQNRATQSHRTMGYSSNNQPQFALLNAGGNGQIWVKATGGANTGTFKIIRSEHASMMNGSVSDSNLNDNGGTITYFERLPDNAHVMEGDAYVKAGNMGLGTQDTKGYRLAVNGKVLAKEIKVEANPWPDYVFEEDYELPDLNELSAYIKANKRLPGMPSAKEVEADGIGLGEMNRLLLEKVEELTLYILHLKNANDSQEERIKILEQQKE